MEHIYADPDHWATVQLIDLTFAMPGHWVVGGFQVHRNHQWKGHGGRLFQQVLDDADREGATLMLTAYGSDSERLGLTHEQLYAFYERRGFVPHPDGSEGDYIRYPKDHANA